LKVISSESLQGWAPYTIKINGLDDLLPGKDPGLDIICDGILNRQEFIYPREKIQESNTQQIG
jgi:hypothetical protein